MTGTPKQIELAEQIKAETIAKCEEELAYGRKQFAGAVARGRKTEAEAQAAIEEDEAAFAALKVEFETWDNSVKWINRFFPAPGDMLSNMR